MIIDQMREANRIEYLKNLLELERLTLESVTKQRDEAVNNYETAVLREHRMQEQRDRLAEVLNDLWHNYSLTGAAYELIEQALAAVKGGSHE